MVIIYLCLNLMRSEICLSSLNLTFSIFALSTNWIRPRLLSHQSRLDEQQEEILKYVNSRMKSKRRVNFVVFSNAPIQFRIQH
ncbi:unnamed protein product [Meloidogyne enterolobii]|uniref:Uncharacterized protein n=1 Tax=Meloidogyne enterolobii TaxID=390850 RepID=A0ACB1AJT9_MELEN